MEAAPPSYELAVLPDSLTLITPYIAVPDLCRAAAVSQRWHGAVARRLWGNPASHFGVENDRVYVALMRFMRTLRTARLLVRSWTHTLHLPPAPAELYNEPRDEWLRDVLDKLPNLQSLVVRGLPFFDHAALRAFAYQPPVDGSHTAARSPIEMPGSSVQLTQQTPANASSGSTLRLLDASRCPNLTASGLVHALARFENLLYLDLSFTYAARDPDALHSLRNLTGLQILKMRGVRLGDEGLHNLAVSIRRRIRSLDIRNNNITDRGLRILLQACFRDTAVPCGEYGAPTLLSCLGSEMLSIYQGAEFEGYLRSTFRTDFVNRLAIEDVPDSGLSHLYIAGNAITIEGASALVRSGRLHVLDLAQCLTPSIIQSDRATGSVAVVPGEEKLVKLLALHAAKSLTFLRIGHSLVTREAQVVPAQGISSPQVELGHVSTNLQRLANPEAEGCRMDEHSQEPPSATTSTVRLSGVSPHLTRREPSPDDIEDGPHLSQQGEDLLAPSVVANPIASSAPALPYVDHAIVTARPALLDNLYHPAMLPRLTVLVLTDIPALSSDRDVTDRLIKLIEHCADEQWSAKERALVDYTAPPGRTGQRAALRTSARNIFALRRLVLELAPSASPSATDSGRSWLQSSTKSMTEDRDGEALWKAAETDFSFFDNDEQFNAPAPQSRESSFVARGKETVTEIPPLPTPATTQLDTVAIISRFRRERREAHAQQSQGFSDPLVKTPGYWDGAVQVIRPIAGLRRDEEQDYHGTVYTGGLIYR